MLSVVVHENGTGTSTAVRAGSSPAGAVVEDVTSTVAGLGAAALTTAARAGTGLAVTAAAPITSSVGAVAVVSYGTGTLLHVHGDDAVDAARRIVGGPAHVGGGGVDAGTQALDRAPG